MLMQYRERTDIKNNQLIPIHSLSTEKCWARFMFITLLTNFFFFIFFTFYFFFVKQQQQQQQSMNSNALYL